MGQLNAAQAKRVLAIFRHVDRILEEVRQHARGEASPLRGHRADLAPEEREELLAAVARIRSRITSGLEGLGVNLPEQGVSSRHAIEASLSFARIALAELTGGGLRRYGALDGEAAAALAGLASELEEGLQDAARTVRGADAAGPPGHSDP
ncbi:MAG: hypothetical protein ACE5HP_04980 [Gemmatimonadota bacterium]